MVGKYYTDVSVDFFGEPTLDFYVLGGQASIYFAIRHSFDFSKKDGCIGIIFCDNKKYSLFDSFSKLFFAHTKIRNSYGFSFLNTIVLYDDGSCFVFDGLDYSRFSFLEKPMVSDDNFCFWSEKEINDAVFYAVKNLGDTKGLCLRFAMAFLSNLVLSPYFCSAVSFTVDGNISLDDIFVKNLCKKLTCNFGYSVFTKIQSSLRFNEIVSLLDCGYALLLPIEKYTKLPYCASEDVSFRHVAVLLRSESGDYVYVDQKGALIVTLSDIESLCFPDMSKFDYSPWYDGCMLVAVRKENDMFSRDEISDAILSVEGKAIIDVFNEKVVTAFSDSDYVKQVDKPYAVFDLSSFDLRLESRLFVNDWFEAADISDDKLRVKNLSDGLHVDTVQYYGAKDFEFSYSKSENNKSEFDDSDDVTDSVRDISFIGDYTPQEQFVHLDDDFDLE